MVKSSVEWIEEITERELEHLKSVRRLNVLFQLTDEYKMPRHIQLFEDFLFGVDRLLFGQDDSLRRRIFGLTPWIMKPGYFVYDCIYKGSVAKHPLKREWLDAKRRTDHNRLMQERKAYYAGLEGE